MQKPFFGRTGRYNCTALLILGYDILYAKNRKAVLLGKHNHSRFDRRLKVAGYREEIAAYIHMRQ